MEEKADNSSRFVPSSRTPGRLSCRDPKRPSLGGLQQGPRYPEASNTSPIAGYAPAAARRTEKIRLIIPRSAPQNTMGGIRMLSRFRIGREIGIDTVLVFYPLPNIPMHFAEAPTIRRQTAYRHSPPTIFALLASSVNMSCIVVCLLGRYRCAEAERAYCLCICSTGIFPFGFARESICILC